MEKIFYQTSFKYLGSIINIYINVFLQVHFKVQAVWYCPHYYPPMLLHQWQICHQYQWHQQYRWQIYRRCHWYWWCTLTCEYLRKFSNKIRNDPYVSFRGSGKIIHEKNLKEKSCDTVPLNGWCRLRALLWLRNTRILRLHRIGKGHYIAAGIHPTSK